VTTDKEYHRKWREKNKEKCDKYSKEYYEKNKKRILEYQKERYRNNRNDICKRVMDYKNNNRESILERHKKRYYEKGRQETFEKWKTPEYRAKSLIGSCRSGSKKRGLEFAISHEDVLAGILTGCCARTGIKFVMDEPKSPWRPSIDRIDNSKGYRKDNIQIVAWVYNCAKYTYSDDVVLEMSRSLVKRNESHS